MILCKRACSLMTEAMENKLTGTLRLRHALHVWLCPACTAYRAQLETTVAALRRLDRPTLSDDSRERACAAFRKAKENS